MNSGNSRYKRFVGSNPTASVNVKHVAEGWTFSAGDHTAGPLKNLGEAFPLRVAALLSAVPEAKLAELEALIERSVRLERLGRKDEAMLLDGELKDELRSWRVHPKDVFKAKLKLPTYSAIQNRAISEGAVLLFYERNPKKCSICHRRLATQLVYLADPTSRHVPNRLVALCDICLSKVPPRWKVIESQPIIEGVRPYGRH